MKIGLLLICLYAPSAVLARVVEIRGIEHLVEACSSANPGDEIVIAPGTYTLTGRSRIHIAARPGPVTLRSSTGNTADVIIQGPGQDDEKVQVVFELTDSPEWQFVSITTRNTFYHGFRLNGGSSHGVLRNVVMRDHGESGVKGTSDPKSDRHPDGLLVEACDIGFNRPRGGTRGVVEGIDGVAVNRWIIRNSRFINIQKGGGVAYGVFTKGNSSDTMIEGNRFENCFIGASFGGGGTGQAYFRGGDRTHEHREGVIRGNTYVESTDAAIYINRGHECSIEDNTLIG